MSLPLEAESCVQIEGLTLTEFLSNLNDLLVIHVRNQGELGSIQGMDSLDRAFAAEKNVIRLQLEVLVEFKERCVQYVPEGHRGVFLKKVSIIEKYFSELDDKTSLLILNSAVTSFEVYVEIIKSHHELEDFILE
jgi:hypothetical protein